MKVRVEPELNGTWIASFIGGRESNYVLPRRAESKQAAIDSLRAMYDEWIARDIKKMKLQSQIETIEVDWDK